ncbi:MAG: hypothetical protein HQL30_12885, partial [Candidatus Omnitrophica bacterium]|nr:hypothetical protein [Candidatus Omnitrophota bacterium]
MVKQCSGDCWYCFAKTRELDEDLTSSIRMTPDTLSLITSEAIDIGFKTIQLNGQDTLGDVDMFFAAARACKDRPVKFSFFTNGFALINDPEYGKSIFQELKKLLGKVEEVDMTISFDPEKTAKCLNRAKRGTPGWEKFRTEEDVYDALANVIHAYRQAFECASGMERSENTPLAGIDVDSYDAYDLLAKTDGIDAFHVSLNSALDKKFGYKGDAYGHFENIGTRLNMTTSEALISAARKGRAYPGQQHTVRALFKSLVWARTQGTPKHCLFTPFLDAARSKLAGCSQKQYFRSGIISPGGLKEELLRAISNPRALHLYQGDQKERMEAMTKEIGFAMAINPGLIPQKQANYEQVESFIFPDKDLMVRMELLFLLEDILKTHAGTNDEIFFKLVEIPEELLYIVFSPDNLNALSRYYKDIARTPFPAHLAVLAEYLPTDGAGVINEVSAAAIRENVVTSISGKCRIKHPGSSGKISLNPRVNDPLKTMPDLKEMGLSPEKFFSVKLSSADPTQRHKGLTLLHTLFLEMADIEPYSDMLEKHLLNSNRPDGNKLTNGELLTVLSVFELWTEHRDDTGKMPYDISTKRDKLMVNIITDILKTTDDPELPGKAVSFLAFLDDKFLESSGAHVIIPATLDRYKDMRGEAFIKLPLIVKLRVFRKLCELNVIPKTAFPDRADIERSFASSILGQWPLDTAEQNRLYDTNSMYVSRIVDAAHLVLEEAEKIGPGTDLDRLFLKLFDFPTRHRRLSELFTRGPESAKSLADLAALRISSSRYDHILDILTSLLEYAPTTQQGKDLVNQVPFEVFEENFYAIRNYDQYRALLEVYTAQKDKADFLSDFTRDKDVKYEDYLALRPWHEITVLSPETLKATERSASEFVFSIIDQMRNSPEKLVLILEDPDDMPLSPGSGKTVGDVIGRKDHSNFLKYLTGYSRFSKELRALGYGPDKVEILELKSDQIPDKIFGLAGDKKVKVVTLAAKDVIERSLGTYNNAKIGTNLFFAEFNPSDIARTSDNLSVPGENVYFRVLDLLTLAVKFASNPERTDIFTSPSIAERYYASVARSSHPRTIILTPKAVILRTDDIASNFMAARRAMTRA